MQILLILVLLTLGEVAYFEFTVEQQTSDGFRLQESARQDELDALQGRNKQLTDTKSGLLENIAAVEGQIAGLSSQVKAPAAGSASPPAKPTNP